VTIRIGISGWRYAPWRGVFYPRGLAQDRELEYAARTFPTIELNGSFYSLQAPQSWLDWYHATPAGFVFAVKANRYITHFRKLNAVEKPLANFFASGIFNLREKLGPILWQLPPQLGFEPIKFERFLSLLPHDTAAALKLARGREARMHGRSRLAIDRNRPLRHAVEIRHESFLDSAFIARLSVGPSASTRGIAAASRRTLIASTAQHRARAAATSIAISTTMRKSTHPSTRSRFSGCWHATKRAARRWRLIRDALQCACRNAQIVHEPRIFARPVCRRHAQQERWMDRDHDPAVWRIVDDFAAVLLDRHRAAE
jgi:uncharacterized protein YecE (DUF72 family)